MSGEDRIEKRDENGPIEQPVGETAPASDILGVVRKVADKKPELLQFMMEMGAGSVENPLHRKMTPEHISRVLALAAKHDERQFELHTKSQDHSHSEGILDKIIVFATFLVVIALTIVVLLLFQDKPDVLIPVLTGIGGLFTGFVGGWGVGKAKSK